MVWEWNLSPGFWIQSQCSFCPTILPKERTPYQVELSTQEVGQSDTWDTVTPEGVEGNLTVYSIGSRGDYSQLSFPSTHTLSYTHTHTLNLFIKSIGSMYRKSQDYPCGAPDKEPTCQCRRCQRCEFNPWVGKIPWRRKWQPTPVFWPGEFHGGLQSIGSKRAGHSWINLAHTF